MRKIVYFTLFFLVMLTNINAYAQERVDLEGATIIGNRELPKVLYVVPWKLPNKGHIISRTITRQISEDSSPITPTNFQRILELHILRQDENQ